MEKNFSEFTSVLKDQREIVDLIKIINSVEFESEPALKSRKDHDFAKLHDTLLHDRTGEEELFMQMLKDETTGNIDLLKELNSILKKKSTDEEAAYSGLLKKKEEIYGSWFNLVGEMGRLQAENKKLAGEQIELQEKRRSLASKRDFINYKLEEYGDEGKINELFEEWNVEYEYAKAEKTNLNAEYKKAQEDEDVLPGLCNDVKNSIRRLKNDMDHARYEMAEILKAFPDIEEKARESLEIVQKYKSVHEDMERTAKILAGLKEQLADVSGEKGELEGTLSEKKEELAPLVETETSLKSQLTDLTNRFNRQEELKEQDQTLKDAINPLAGKLREWRSKITDYDDMSARINKETETLKEESLEMASEIKELNSLVGPVKELRQKLDEAQKESSSLDEQGKQSAEEIKKLKEENDMLSVKATQFNMIKEKLEGLK